MEKLGNEKGYALLLVLFLIVFITVITVVFITGSLSNAKQEQRVDENQLAVTAAEAGVDYYKTGLLNKYVESQNELDQLANVEMARQREAIDKKIQTSFDYNLVKQKVSAKLLSKLNDEIDKYFNESAISITDNYAFEFQNQPSKEILSLVDYNIYLHASVKGKHKTREDKVFQSMDLDMTFTLKDFSASAGPTTPSQIIDMNNLYPDDSVVPSCGSSKDLKNEKCKASRNIDYEQIKNHSTVYFPQGYYKNGDLELKSDAFIYSKAGIKEGDTGFHANKLVVKGNSIFTHTGSLRTTVFEVKDDTKFFIKGSMNIFGEADFKNDSVIAILGSGRFYNHLSIKNNSTVCVNGSITVDGDFEIKNGGKMYIFGALNKPPSGDGKVIPVGPTEVFSYCSATSPGENTWPSPKVDASYR